MVRRVPRPLVFQPQRLGAQLSASLEVNSPSRWVGLRKRQAGSIREVWRGPLGSVQAFLSSSHGGIEGSNLVARNRWIRIFHAKRGAQAQSSQAKLTPRYGGPWDETGERLLSSIRPSVSSRGKSLPELCKCSFVEVPVKGANSCLALTLAVHYGLKPLLECLFQELLPANTPVILRLTAAVYLASYLFRIPSDCGSECLIRYYLLKSTNVQKSDSKSSHALN